MHHASKVISSIFIVHNAVTILVARCSRNDTVVAAASARCPTTPTTESNVGISHPRKTRNLTAVAVVAAMLRSRNALISETQPSHDPRSDAHTTYSFTWAWFAFPLSTGGIGLLLNDTPNQFEGLKTIGKIFFIFAIVVTLSATAAITTRFIRHSSAFRRSLKHPTEGLFFPVAILNRTLC